MTGGNFQAKTISKFIQNPCDNKQNLRGRIEVVAQSAQKKALHEFHTGLASTRFELCV
jgi:hypothetical protein